MRALLLLFVLAAAVSCRGDYITLRTQTFPQPSRGTLFVLGGQQGGQPSMLGSLTRIQLQPMQMEMQGSAGAQPFSSVFTDRRSSLFDSSLSAWMDQQIAALDSLQAALDAAPQMKMPCPRAAAEQANMPDVMSYMASSRFGPAFFGALAQQEMQDDVDTSAYDNVGDDEFFDDEDAKGFDAGGVGDYAAQQWANDFTWEQPELSAETLEGGSAEGRGFYPSMLAEEDGFPTFNSQEDLPPSTLAANEDDDGPAWVFVMDDGSINWGLMLFLLLAFGVLFIWIRFWTTLFRLSRAYRQQMLQEAAAPCKVPLLAEWKGIVAPLAPEKPMAEKSAPQIFKSVQIASEQTPTGTYFAPRGNEYVTIAYVPLKGEQ